MVQSSYLPTTRHCYYRFLTLGLCGDVEFLGWGLLEHGKSFMVRIFMLGWLDESADVSALLVKVLLVLDSISSTDFVQHRLTLNLLTIGRIQFQ